MFDDETGEVIITYQEKEAYFKPKATARNFIVRHLGKSVPGADLFTEEVFSDEVIDELDEKVIKPLFAFKSNDEDLNQFFEDEEMFDDE